MNYHNITKDDLKNGDGVRVVLWVAGCNHKCKECQNPETWDSCGGLPFDEEAKAELFAELAKDYISGITLSGGDPLFPDSRDSILALMQEIAEKFPNKTIWLYTGYTFEQIQNLPHLKYVDVLVEGPYIPAMRELKLKWRGSSNQRVIMAKESLCQNKLIVRQDDGYMDIQNTWKGCSCGC